MTDRRLTDGALAWKPLEGNRELAVYPLTFGRARLVVGRQGGGCYEDAF